MIPDSSFPASSGRYLDRLFAAPPGARWPIARGWIGSEPRPFFAELREKAPVLATPEVTLLAKRADVVEVLSLPSVFSVALYKPKMGEFMLAQDETPLHTRDKAVMRAMLSRDDLPRIRAMVGLLTDEALDAAGGRIDVVSQLARLVPLRITQRYFGFAAPDTDMLRWSYANQLDAFNNLPFDERPDAAAVAEAATKAREEMVAALASLIPTRLKAIGAGDETDDVLSRLLRTPFPAGVGFGMPQVVANVGGLLIGAIETTSEAIVNALAELFARPDMLAAATAAAAGDPDDFDGFVWEAMRFAPIVAFMFRRAETDHVLARGTPREVLIRKGTIVLPLSLSAMFDDDWVDRPDTFMSDRPQEVYLHFGYGHHACLGRYVGSVLIPEAVRRVLLRGSPDTVGAVSFDGTPFPESFVLTYPRPQTAVQP